MSATITLVDKVIDAASNTFRVRLQLSNPGQALPAGLRCKIDFSNGADAAATASTTPPAGAGLPRNVTAAAGSASPRP
jgi:multidrug efflux pump subunit AcrA (membrane-fusion protein)